MNSVSDVGYVRPGGDPAADTLSDWAVQLMALLEGNGYRTHIDVSAQSPCDRVACEAALAAPVPMLFFFGHGRRDALLESAGEPLIDKDNVSMAAGRTLVSVACEAGLEFGPMAVQAGARAHLGWNVLLLWLVRPDYKTLYGEAIVRPLSLFGHGSSISEVADELQRALNKVSHHYRAASGIDRNAKLAYYAAAAAAGQIAVDGDRHVRPLSKGVASAAVGWVRWQGMELARYALKALRGGKRD
jgi:hypothetical protein